MSFLELAKKRYSVRNYDTVSVSREKIIRCVEAARLAPSACNSQPWKFLVVDAPDLKDRVARAAFEGILDLNHFAYRAPILVLMISQRQKLSAKLGAILKKKNFSQMDIGMAAVHFCLQAAEEDLGTCMMGWFNETKVKKLLSIPIFKRVELILSVGYPADKNGSIKNRKQIEEILDFNQYT